MSYQTVDNVKYYTVNGNYVAVGDNTTTYGNGISSTSYSGTIIIREKLTKRAFYILVNIHSEIANQ